MNQNVYGTQHQDTPPAAYIPREMFSVGEVLGTGIKIWLKNFISYVALTGICYLPLFIYAAVKLGSGSNLTISKLQSMQTVGYVVAVASLVLNFVAAGAVTYGVVMSLRGTPVGIGECITTGIKRFLPAIGVSIVAALCICLGFIAIIIPGIILMCVLYVAVPVCIIEARGVGGALSRSAALTKGHKGGIFGLLFIVGVINFVINKILTATLVPSPASLTTSAAVDDFVKSLPKIVYISIAESVIMGSLGAVLCAVSYYLLRSEKEGTNIDQIGSVFD
jgi:hypothetical protein